MLINPRLYKGLFAVKEATMPYIQSAVHAFEPSYVRHPKQSFIGGTYRPLADESMIDTPSCFDVRHRAELYTHKALFMRNLRTETSTYQQRKYPTQPAIRIFLRLRTSSMLPLLLQRRKLTSITHYRRCRALFKRFGQRQRLPGIV